MRGRITDKNYVLGFLSGKTKDYKGRTYEEMLKWDNTQLENCHDQVQHFFPLHEDSGHAVAWPVLTREVLEEAKQDQNILNNIKKGSELFASFFALDDPNAIERHREWCRPKNHNLLRVTRIIRCLRLFGMEKEAKDFYDKALKAGDGCGELDNVSKSYWWRAMNEDVWDTLK